MKRRLIVCDALVIKLLKEDSKDQKVLFMELCTECHMYAQPQVDLTVDSETGPKQLTMNQVKLKLSGNKKVTILF